MKATMADTEQDANRGTKTAKPRDIRLSPDGKWRSFPKAPNLVQYVNTSAYFGRVKIEGKIFRESLGTDVFTTAKLLLNDWVKAKRKRTNRPVTGSFAEARRFYETDIEADHTLKAGSKLYRRNCIKALLRTWPELDAMSPVKISESNCRTWAARFTAAYDEQFFNNTLSTLRHIIERAGIGHDENPARKLKRLGVKPKQLQLPEPEQFEKLLSIIETSGAGQARHCADFVRFLAFSGCRLSEARQVHWLDIDFKKSEIRVQTAKRSKTSNSSQIRFVPIIPPMLTLLERLSKNNPQPQETVCHVAECEKSLTRACKLLQIHRITHHDLRHLFATRCIEAGVDIPTVARWLGHSDGGALAMKVYGHLRREHSASMAQRVTFGQAA